MTPANASTAMATVLLDELARCGVRDLVLAPGSRSAALAFAAYAARDRVRLHTRVDERSETRASHLVRAPQPVAARVEAAGVVDQRTR